MKGKKKNSGVRIWAVVSSVLIVFLAVATLLTQVVMVDLISSLLGRDVAVYKDGTQALYTQTYADKAEVYAAANAMNQRVCEEGFVLLKNDDHALPLDSNSKISVFGKNSVNLAYGGSGSSGGDKSQAVDLYQSLEAAGFSVNPTLKAFYEDDKRPRPCIPM